MTRRSLRFARWPAVLVICALASCARAEAPPPLGPQTYALTFDRPASPQQFAATYPGLTTWGYFGAEPARAKFEAALKRPLTQAERFTSRAWPGTLNVNVDDDYCPGAASPKVEGGALRIVAYRLAPNDVSSCGHGRAWASAYVSSQPSFSQTYGYFEAKGSLPCDPGRWPSFWLLPTTKTATNDGRLPEIDVFEHYGGAITVMSRGRPFVINRVGQPFSTIHTGVHGAEVAASNAQKLPPMSDKARAAWCEGEHSFGVLWTPMEFRFYVDREETFRTPNPGVSDPHYWVLNMDVSPTAGDPSKAPGPSTYAVRYVKAWALPASGAP